MNDTKWEKEEFDILQVSQCSGVLAVHAYKSEDANGFKLEADPVDFIAVAKITTRYLQSQTDGSETEYAPPGVRTEVVGVQIVEGMFEICNENENFAGYCKEGDDIRLATAYLSDV